MNEISLLALSGLAPQVVTEAAWSLARQHYPPLTPRSVEVIATGVGEAYARAQLLGEPTHDPVTGQPVPHAADRWGPFCEELYGRPVPLRLHVPTADGQPIADVTGVEADRCFADLCYGLVAELTRPDQPPLVGSLAGGRKTLSAHLMAAFTVYARPQDRLIHVLVHPPSAERDPTFFHPHTGSDARVHRVDVPFPRLRAVLEESPLRDTLHERADLHALMAAIQPFVDAEQVPESFSLTLGDGRAELAALHDGSALASVRLTPAETATLLVVADALAADATRVRLDTLAESEATEAQRAAVLEACARYEPLRPWSAPSDVSKAVSRLNRALSRLPLLARYLSVESDVTAEATFYRWAEPHPARLTVYTLRAPEVWPLAHLPLTPVARAKASP